jgi:hypothetical protein
MDGLWISTISIRDNENEVVAMSVDLEQRMQDTPVEDYTQYRAISITAIISCALGVLSVVTFLSWTFAVIPLLGVIMGVIALVRIRSNPAELVGTKIANIGIALCLLFAAAGGSYLVYDYMTEVPPGYERLSYATLRADVEQPGQLYPPEVDQLEGHRVFIKGYVYPTKSQTGVKEFILCRDNGDCCFGGQPPLTERIMVDLKGHLTYTYAQRMVRVAGTFHVKPASAIDGLGGVLYHLDADYLK